MTVYGEVNRITASKDDQSQGFVGGEFSTFCY
jgi:hypothetical protein